MTKRGKPVASVVPLEPPANLRGSVTYLVDEQELLTPFDEDWAAHR